MIFDEKNATADELWKWCLKEYKSRNFIKKFLINNFFSRIEKIVRLLEPDDKILEVGCGCGESSRRISKMLRSQHFEVSDVDKRYIQKLKEHDFPLKVTRESVYSLKRNDKEFDCVLLLEVLEHLENVEGALRELFRISRKYVVISVPNEPLWRILNLVRGRFIRHLGNTPGHINHWSPSSVKKLISKYGIIRKIHMPIPWIIVLAEVKS